MNYQIFQEERKLWKKGYYCVVGIDEAGRGSLAGPVIAAALIDLRLKISDLRFLKKIKDSKKLSFQKREELYRVLNKHPNIKWGIGRVSEKVIDKINILEATKLAMKKAVQNLEKKLQKLNFHNFKQKKKTLIDYLILDGNFKININLSQKSIIKADEKVFSCALASIVAKVNRDRIMQKYHKKYPQYGFDKHKGYSTKLHFKTLKKYGPSPIHRKSFKPIMQIKN